MSPQDTSPRGHRAVLTANPDQPRRGRPTPGPVAIGPNAADDPAVQHFVDAIRAGGGTVGSVDDGATGLVWLSASTSSDLDDVLSRHPQIGWVQLPMAGVDAFDQVLARHADPEQLLWTSAKGAYSEPVAEHALAMTLALLRSFPERARTASWDDHEKGISLYGLEVVIIGAGGIAIETMRLLAPFEPVITIVRRGPDPVPGADYTVRSSDLGEVLPTADVVIVAAAMTSDTHHLIGATELASMKPTAVLVNVARGGLVDTDALVAALETGSIGGAGLDVTDPEPLPDGHPLWSLPTALITPHQADTSEMVAPLLAERIRHNVAALSGDGDFIGIVDAAAGY